MINYSSIHFLCFFCFFIYARLFSCAGFIRKHMALLKRLVEISMAEFLLKKAVGGRFIAGQFNPHAGLRTTAAGKLLHSMKSVHEVFQAAKLEACGQFDH
jgi:hypothetical protein